MQSAGEVLPGALHPDLDSALEDKSEKMQGNLSSKRFGKGVLQRKKNSKRTRVVQLGK